MRRRSFLKTGGGLALAALGPISQPARAVSGAKRPNIIFLLTDDHRWDAVGCMGNSIIHTPNMDDMARNGVLFRNAYVTTSICYASRASILTGQYNRAHGINGFSQTFSEEAFANTYPMLLRAAGYRTGFIGKYGVGRNLPAEKFDVWHGFPGQGRYENTDEAGNYKHLTRIMGEQAIGFIEGSSTEQPFCLSISFKAPHVQDNDPRQFLNDPAYDYLYRDDVIPVPKTAAPKYYASFPEFFRENNEGRNRWKKRFATPEMYQESVKRYYRLITGVDVVIGEMRETLRARGLAENTILILIGDNGFYLSEHGLAGKWYGHEESIRVPLIVYDPRLPRRRRGQTREEMALSIDIAPTILSMAGLPIPARMQGRDLTPLLRGKRVSWREDFFYEHLFAHKAIPKSEGVVTKRYKYLCYFEQDPVYEELYDLEKDPHEERNLAGISEYGKILARLRARCTELREAAK